jgi:hypothetical protein
MNTRPVGFWTDKRIPKTHRDGRILLGLFGRTTHLCYYATLNDIGDPCGIKQITGWFICDTLYPLSEQDPTWWAEIIRPH